MIDNNQIIEIVNKIASNYRPERIIIFGSYATGNFTDESDLDFILIKDTSLPRNKRGVEVRRLFYGVSIPMDFKIYTPVEFNLEINNKYSFLSSAIKEGKILYERKN